MPVNKVWMILSIFMGALAGCAPASTPTAQPPAEQPAEPTTVPPTVTPAPLLPSGWETYTNQAQCSYAVSHPSDLDGASQDAHSWLLTPASTSTEGPAPNFVYLSVIPDDFQAGGDQIIYNYDPVATQSLLSLQVGESKSIHQSTDFAPWFTYTRLPDTLLSNQPAQVYENTQPWEFPPGIKEIRYLLKANGCTYLIGGYLTTTDADQPGAIDQELFDQILATFRLAP
jgi:hypothetical protein